ncbi:hypothetical protein Sjap_022382 [Stephania japonica]|uniref:Uncharacterized protein n=1 Tax=Stephania japonica TaxID=461633 RepID=A0AAP0HUZ2_9MAGN
MAPKSIKLTATIIFLIILAVVSDEIVCVEGRQLKSEKQNPKLSNNGGGSMISTNAEGHQEDYRPTMPGHSPGIGHHIFPLEGRLLGSELAKQELYCKLNNCVQRGGHDKNLLARDTKSDSVVHVSTKRELIMVSNGSGVEEDYNQTALGHTTLGTGPTSPGHSPGIGHSFRGKIADPLV